MLCDEHPLVQLIKSNTLIRLSLTGCISERLVYALLKYATRLKHLSLHFSDSQVTETSLICLLDLDKRLNNRLNIHLDDNVKASPRVRQVLNAQGVLRTQRGGIIEAEVGVSWF